MREELFFTAEETDGTQRIDKFLSEQLPDRSRSYIQKLIKDGLVQVNGKQVKANYKLDREDEVKLEIPELEIPDILPENIPIDVLYEDEDLMIVNKPKQMVVHPAPGHYTGTGQCSDVSLQGESFRDQWSHASGKRASDRYGHDGIPADL